jgi:hypothetical protein
MNTARYVGTRMGEEVILLDRRTGRLIHLDSQAARVWDNCRLPGGPRGVLRELERAGVVTRMSGGYVRPPVDWT